MRVHARMQVIFMLDVISLRFVNDILQNWCESAHSIDPNQNVCHSPQLITRK